MGGFIIGLISFIVLGSAFFYSGSYVVSLIPIGEWTAIAKVVVWIVWTLTFGGLAFVVPIQLGVFWAIINKN